MAIRMSRVRPATVIGRMTWPNQGNTATIRKPYSLFLGRYERPFERGGQLEANGAHHRGGRSWIQQHVALELANLDLQPPSCLCVRWVGGRGFPSAIYRRVSFPLLDGRAAIARGHCILLLGDLSRKRGGSDDIYSPLLPFPEHFGQ